MRYASGGRLCGDGKQGWGFGSGELIFTNKQFFVKFVEGYESITSINTLDEVSVGRVLDAITDLLDNILEKDNISKKETLVDTHANGVDVVGDGRRAFG